MATISHVSTSIVLSLIPVHASQVCLCGSRIFVQRKIYDAFLPRFVAAVAALRLGDPSLDTTDVGPVSCAMHRDKVVSYIQLGVEEGGTIECGSGAAAAGAGAALGGAGAGAAGAADADAAAGGLREPGAPPAGLPAHLAGGFFVPPTVISGLAPSSRTATEEIFGPVCTVHPFDSEDEVVGAVNAGERCMLALPCPFAVSSRWPSSLWLAALVCAAHAPGFATS